ncbi:hypothetical protein WG66_010707 [Moniliophthora roreri]|uniref:Ribosome assembly protein 3 n=1 Tax=Moniliophthora roreri TaxID=221103 RepID=A0A0W0F1S0_MONRR|nr:hypothetical protein WG66_010707 [Moniliophthora roreri]
MAPAPAAAAAGPRKRNRKRKRRAAYSSSSSSSSNSSDSESGTGAAEVITRKIVKEEKPAESDDEAASLSSSDSSSSSPDSDLDQELDHGKNKPVESQPQKSTKKSLNEQRAWSPSPPPPSSDIPSFLPPKDSDSGESSTQKEQELRERFRKFWMGAVADGFKDDLEEIRKEPNLTTSKLSVLIDSLASGADLFSSSDKDGVNEMKMVVG